MITKRPSVFVSSHTSARTAMSAGPAGTAGFSVVEGLIAAGMLLLIAVGILPLFTQAIRNNYKGERTGTASNMARSTLERYLSDDFGSPQLTLPDGAEELVTQDYWTNATGSDATPEYAWRAVPAQVSWSRTTRVQQFQRSIALASSPIGAVVVVPGPVSTGDPLPGGVSEAFLTSKLVEVEIESFNDPANPALSNSLLNTNTKQRVRMLKTY